MGRHRSRGTSIAETAAAMVLLLPLLICIMFVVLEASKAYMIKESLSQGARQAARDLSVTYGNDASIANNPVMEDVRVYSNIRMTGVIASSNQFQSTWDTASSPPTVTTTVQYTSGRNGLPVFPNPDPLHLGRMFQLSATSTYRLE